MDVVLNETKGTMHGYDIMTGAPTVQDSMRKRMAFMKRFTEAEIVQES